MTWQINLINDFRCSGETCLELTHHHRYCQLRNWFGPFAQRLFNSIKDQLLRSNDDSVIHQIIVDKQFAQYLLVQASFLHQRCMHQYQVHQDIHDKGITYSHELGELLLYVRMTPQHPSQQTLEHFIDTQLAWCDETEQAIHTLLESKLIQKIKFNQQTYYDKNPYPHDHILNLDTNILSDYTGQEYMGSTSLQIINHNQTF